MTAKGKINASRVQLGDRILVKVTVDGVRLSDTKTGLGVQVARVIGKTRVLALYAIETTAGKIENLTSVQTMWLAPEDAAGIKRAHAEALSEQIHRDVMEGLEEEAYAEDEAHSAPASSEAGAEWASPATPEIGPAQDLTLQSHDGKVISVSENETPDLTGSAVVRLLERVWERIRQNHPELPNVVMVTGSGTIGASKWGHFRANGWKAAGEGADTDLRMHEMFMAGEALAKGARQVLQTMLHEGAHTLAKVRGLQDTSRQGRWHNAKFRDLAKEMGLEHKAASADSAHGFSFVTLTEDTVAEYADLMAELDEAIRLVISLPGWLGGSDEDDEGGERIGTKPPVTGEKNSSNLKLTCECEEPKIIRASKKVADLMVVNCGDCDALFLERS